MNEPTIIFTPTGRLRWKRPDPMGALLEAICNKQPTLQQEFLGSNGAIEWRDVPTQPEGEK